MPVMDRLGALCSALLLTACASSTSTQINYQGPRHPTAVITAKTSMTGSLAPDFTGDQLVYTRTDKRLIRNNTTFDNLALRWLNADAADIFRMDTRKLLRVDFGNERYMECPLAGCANGLDALLANAGTSEGDDETYESYETRGCQIMPVSSDVTVTPTGKQRTIVGLPAQEFVVDFKSVVADQQGREDESHLRFIFWTTQPTSLQKEIWNIHRAATENYLNSDAKNHVMARLLGNQAFKAVGAFLGDIERSDKEQYNDLNKKLAGVTGYPLSIQMDLFQRSNACPESSLQKAATQGTDFSAGWEGAATDLLGGYAKEQGKKLLAGDAPETLVSYRYEITSVRLEDVADSAFDAPPGFERVTEQAAP